MALTAFLNLQMLATVVRFKRLSSGLPWAVYLSGLRRANSVSSGLANGASLASIADISRPKVRYGVGASFLDDTEASLGSILV